MRPYEAVIIIEPGLEDDAVEAIVKRASEVVTSRGGTVNGVDRWGKRRFAYELKHKWEGWYVLLSMTCEPEASAELDHSLHLVDEVLRHKVVRLPDHVAGRARRKPASNDAPAPEAAQTTGA